MSDLSMAWLLPAAATGVLTWAGIAAYGLLRAVSTVRGLGRRDIAGQWFVVTGCDSGFGQGVVQELVQRQAKVIAFCFTADGASRALELGATLAPQVDLTDEAQLQQAAQTVLEHATTGLAGLVHNAGAVLPGFIEYQPLSVYRHVMEVNFFAPVRLTQLLLPAVRAAHGRVVLVSSVDGLVSLPGNAPYDASKFALEGYADALRVELGLWGLHVSVVNPSTMRTPLAMTFFEGHRRSWAQMNAEDPEGSWKQHYPEDWLNTFIEENTANLEAIAQDPAYAIGDIVHALTAKRPQLRYLSGTTAKTLFWALWVMPEAVSHRVKQALARPLPPTARGG